MEILNRKIILASKSPRRKQLLEQAGFNISIQTKEVEENYQPELLEKVLSTGSYSRDESKIGSYHLCLFILETDSFRDK